MQYIATGSGTSELHAWVSIPHSCSSWNIGRLTMQIVPGPSGPCFAPNEPLYLVSLEFRSNKGK
jgi:hypothetical protein